MFFINEDSWNSDMHMYIFFSISGVYELSVPVVNEHLHFNFMSFQQRYNWKNYHVAYGFNSRASLWEELVCV